MNENNILSLKTRLVQLGFEPSVETMLRCHICFMPAAFDLVLVRQEGDDRFHFTVHLEKAEKDLYVMRYYQATLRKEVLVPPELEPIDQVMKLVDWHALVNGKLVSGLTNNSAIQTAFDVLGQLQNVGSVGDLLKYKYWAGTALEPMVTQLAGLRSEWEISERFYFFDEKVVISFDDAVRFLSSRWMEKQFAARRKLLVRKSEGRKENGSVAGSKLLSKNPRKLTKRGNNKSI